MCGNLHLRGIGVTSTINKCVNGGGASRSSSIAMARRQGGPQYESRARKIFQKVPENLIFDFRFLSILSLAISEAVLTVPQKIDNFISLRDIRGCSKPYPDKEKADLEWE